MIVWSSPHIRYWHAAQGVRRSSTARLRPAMAAILELGSRSDRIGRRARNLLANIRFGRELDAAERRPEHIYICRPGRTVTAARPMPESGGRLRLLAESEHRIAQAEGRIARQIELIEEIAATNPAGVSRAMALLSLMQASLRLMQEHKQHLLRDIQRSVRSA